MVVRVTISLVLLLLPSILWLCCKQFYSPWWLENLFSTPMVIILIYCLLMIAVVRFFPIKLCLIYLVINFLIASLLNNDLWKTSSLSMQQSGCLEPTKVFQFNMKYAEGTKQIAQLKSYLLEGRYHLIALQGVSQQLKVKLIAMLNPYYPYFINGAESKSRIFTDQLIFSRFAFANVRYDQSRYLISSQWFVADKVINLYTLHPPSPRNKKLWKVRNNVLHQVKINLNKPSKNTKMLIGDLNISKHSNRINDIVQSMHTVNVNSWPKNRYIFPFTALAIDHLWLSKSETICERRRVDNFNWSDHFAIETNIAFSNNKDN